MKNIPWFKKLGSASSQSQQRSGCVFGHAATSFQKQLCRLYGAMSEKQQFE